MANAVLYSSFDGGAPPAGLGVNTSNSGSMNALYNLLVACLVTGYGVGPSAKPGQGWELIHADLPTGFKLKSPDKVYYTFYRGPNTTYAAAQSVQVYMSESITGLAAYPPVGLNVRSGPHAADYSSHANRHCIAVGGWSATPSAWFVAARGSQVLVHWLTASTPESEMAYPSNCGGSLFFGNPVIRDPSVPKSGVQNSCILGGFYRANTLALSSENASDYLRGAVSRLRSPISGAVETGPVSDVIGRGNLYTDHTGARFGISSYAPDLCLERVNLWQGGSLGYIPGKFYSTYYSHRDWLQVYPLLGMPPQLSSGALPYVVDGEPFYFLPAPYGVLPISLLEKYWDG